MTERRTRAPNSTSRTNPPARPPDVDAQQLGGAATGAKARRSGSARDQQQPAAFRRGNDSSRR